MLEEKTGEESESEEEEGEGDSTTHMLVDD